MKDDYTTNPDYLPRGKPGLEPSGSPGLELILVSIALRISNWEYFLGGTYLYGE